MERTRFSALVLPVRTALPAFSTLPTLRALLLVCALAVLGSSLGCGEDPAAPDPEIRLPLGVYAVHRGSPGADPLMAEAYSDIGRGGFAWSQAEIDWGTAERRFGVNDWSVLDDHLRQSRRTGVPVSLVIRVIDETALGSFPDDLRGQGFASPNVRVRFPIFVQAVLERSRGQLAQLWIGRAVDRRLDDHPEELEPFRELLALVADSVATIEPDLPVGVSFRYRGSPVSGAVGALAPMLDRIGWIVDGLDEHYLPAGTPDAALALVREAVALQPEIPTVLTEVGYRRVGGDGDADQFLAGLLEYLESAPAHLVGATWFSLYDWYVTTANERAATIHPDDPDAAEEYAGWLRSSGLGLVNGVPTPLWFRVFDWNEAAVIALDSAARVH